MEQDELEDPDQVQREGVLDDWTLVDLSRSGIEISLKFNDPMQVSQDDSPDILFVQLELSVLKDSEDLSLPVSLIK